MDTISDVAELEALYGAPVTSSVDKVMDHVTPAYRTWIESCRFVVLSTVGAGGTDASPRGDVGPVVRIADPKTLLLPDWRGNNRIDSLRNIVTDGQVSLMFMVPGSNNVVRVNGTGAVTTDAALTGAFEQNGKHPRSVIVINVAEVYFQCAKALMRSELWSAAHPEVPTAGDFLKEFKAGFDGAAYDAGYSEYARPKMW